MMKWILLFLLNGYLCVSHANEKLGTLRVEDILVRPQLLVKEPQTGEFSLGESSVALSWQKNPKLGALVRIGSLELLNPMAHFQDEVDDSLGFVEAYAQVTGDYGLGRFGLIPVQFGLEGGYQESKLIFPRGYFFSKRVLPLRDMGASYEVGYDNYYTRIAVHNGESGDNVDGRMFVTSSWGWHNRKNFHIGVSAHTGTTKPESTSTSTETLAAVDVNEEAKWRIADLYVHWYGKRWQFLFEGIFGQLEQDLEDPDEEDTEFNGGYAELRYKSSPYFAVHLRYDHFDPNEKLDEDLERAGSLAFAFTDKHDTNALYLMGTKIWEQGEEVNNDEFRLIWRLSPELKH